MGAVRTVNGFLAVALTGGLLLSLSAQAGTPAPAAKAPERTAAAFDLEYRQFFDKVLYSYDNEIDWVQLERLLASVPPGDAARALRALSAQCLDWEWWAKPGSIATLEAGIEEAIETDDLESQVRLSSCHSNLSDNQGNTQRAFDEAEQTLALAKQRHLPARLLVYALLTRSHYASQLGNQSTALIDWEEVERLLPENLRARGLRMLEFNRTMAYRRMEDFDQARLHLENFKSRTEPGHRWQESLQILIEAGYLEQDTGNFQAALNISEEIMRVSVREDDHASLASGMKNKAEALVALKRFKDALSTLEEFDLLPDIGKPTLLMGLADIARGQAFAGLGQHHNALAAYERAQSLLTEANIPRYLSRLYQQRALSLEATGNPAAALADFRRYVELRDAIKSRVEWQRQSLRRMTTQVTQARASNEQLRLVNAMREKQVEALSSARRWQLFALSSLLALMVALGVILRQLLRRSHTLRKLASTDSLTGFANRAQVLADGERMVARDPLPIGVMILDIDHFKRINDTYGHPAGDRMLVAFAECCVSQAGNQLGFGRLGGEEFLLIGRLSVSDMAALAEKIRVCVEKMEVLTEDGAIMRATVSIGYTNVIERDKDALRRAIMRADRALYVAKDSGRNRVVFEASAAAAL